MTIQVTVKATGTKAFVFEGSPDDEEPRKTEVEQGNEQIFSVYGENVLVVSEKDFTE